MIAQQWLNVAGLGLDFAGVVLLAFEWRAALKHEAHEAEEDGNADKREDQAQKGPIREEQERGTATRHKCQDEGEDRDWIAEPPCEPRPQRRES